MHYYETIYFRVAIKHKFSSQLLLICVAHTSLECEMNTASAATISNTQTLTLWQRRHFKFCNFRWNSFLSAPDDYVLCIRIRYFRAPCANELIICLHVNVYIDKHVNTVFIHIQIETFLLLLAPFSHLALHVPINWPKQEELLKLCIMPNAHKSLNHTKKQANKKDLKLFCLILFIFCCYSLILQKHLGKSNFHFRQ